MGLFNKAFKTVSNLFYKVSDYFASPASKKERLHKAISECNQGRVSSLLGHYANDDKERPFLVDAVRYGNEKIVNMVLNKWGVDKNNKGHNTVVEDAVFRADDAIFNLLLEKGADVNGLRRTGTSALHAAVFLGKEDYAKSILNHPDCNLSKINAKRNVLYQCAMFDQYDLAKLLVKKGSNMDAVVDDNLTVKQVFALNDGSHNFLKEVGNFASDQELNDYITLSRSKAILNLSYSNDAFGATSRFAKKIIKRAVTDSDFPHKQDVLDILDSVGKRDENLLPLEGGHYLTVEEVNYRGHAAYFVIENNKKHQPIKITYCDGNGLMDKKGTDYCYGAATFDIDHKKLKSLTGSKSLAGLNGYLEKAFDVTSAEMYRHGNKKFNEVMSKCVVCDKNQTPIVTHKSIPTKPQKRGNCTLKSFDTMYKEVSSRIKSWLNHVNIDGVQSGKGYESYKEYKSAMTKKPINDLLELAGDDNKGKAVHVDALEFLKENIFLKAAAKNDVDLLSRMKKIFDSNNIDFTQIRKKGRDAKHMAEKNGNEEVLQWLTQNSHASNHVESPSKNPASIEASTFLGNEISQAQTI